MQSFGALLLNYEQTENCVQFACQTVAPTKNWLGKAISLAGSGRPPFARKSAAPTVAVVDANDSWVTCEQLMPMLPL